MVCSGAFRVGDAAAAMTGRADDFVSHPEVPGQDVLPLDVTPVCPAPCGKTPATGRWLCVEHQRDADADTLAGLMVRDQRRYG